MTDSVGQVIELAMTCPTCNARQKWSDECRRCKCDLSELRAVWQASRHARAKCFAHLRAGHLDRALRWARHHAVLRVDNDVARLLAVCHLLRGDWADAIDLYSR